MVAAGAGVARARIVVDATAQACWEAWTQRDALSSWYAERVDGAIAQGNEIVLAWDSLGQAIPLRVVEASPPTTLRLAGQPPGRPAQAQRVHIVDRGRTREIEVEHAGFRDGPGGEDERAGTEAGWKAALALFRLYLEHYRGSARACAAAVGVASAPPDVAYATLAGGLALSERPAPGDRPAVVLGGEVLRGEVLIAEPPFQLLVWLREIDATLALRTFPAGPADGSRSSIAAAQLSCWGESAARLPALRPGLESLAQDLFAGHGAPPAQA